MILLCIRSPTVRASVSFEKSISVLILPKLTYQAGGNATCEDLDSFKEKIFV